jgi:hypothetical protein
VIVDAVRAPMGQGKPGGVLAGLGWLAVIGLAIFLMVERCRRDGS